MLHCKNSVQRFERLPYTLLYKTYKLKEDGKEKLEKIIDVIIKARTNAEKRATDENNHSSDVTTASNKTKITHVKPDITDSLCKTPPNNCASRFDSWTHLCLGMDRRYPEAKDIFRSANYGRRPKKFNSGPKAKINPECRICKLLENSGKHEGELYVNHYGNFPTHCPQWTKMDLYMKINTSERAKYCL